jgi:hypothetical protein
LQVYQLILVQAEQEQRPVITRQIGKSAQIGLQNIF